MQFRNQKILFIVIGSWVALVFLILLSVNCVIHSNFICTSVLNKFGLGFSAQELKTNFDLKFNLNIKAKNIGIYNKNKTVRFVELNNPDISIKPFSILFKKINIKKFNSDDILITVKRDKNGNIDILDALNINPEKYNNFSLTGLNSSIKKLELNYDDDYIIESKTKLLLNDSDIKISKIKDIFYIKETGKSETSINQKPYEASDINLCIKSNYALDKSDFKVDINNINLYLFSDIAKKFISQDIVSLEGFANIDINTDETHKFNLKITNPSLKLKDNIIINPYKEINANADFLIDKSKLTINNLDILSKDLNYNLKGEIAKLFSKSPQIDVSMDIKDTEFNNIVYFIPDNLIFYRPQGIPILKKSNFHGTINGNINLKYSPLDMTGTIKLENIYIPGYPKAYRQNDATLLFMKDKMHLYTRVYTPDNEYVIIDGISNLDDSLYGKYSVKSTKKINLSFAQKYLVPIQQVIGFNIGPVPIMDIDGYGNIDIKAQGTIKDAQIFGQFNAYDASAIIHGLDAKLVNGDCKLIFDNKNLIFKEVKGSLDGAKFLLTGMGNTKGEVELTAKINQAYLDKILKTFNNSVLTKPYTGLFKNVSAVSGLLNTEINLKGTIKDYETEDFLNSLALNGNFELINNKVILNNGFKISNITGVVNFDQNNGQNGAFEFLINNSKLNASFDTKEALSKIASGESFNFNAAINSQKCLFSDVLKELSNNKAINPNLANFIKEFDNVDFYSKLSLNLSGKISVNNINFNDIKTRGYIVGLNSAVNKNIKFIKGLIRLDNNNVVFDNFQAALFEGMITAKGSYNDDLKISLNNINLDRFDKLIPKTKLQNSVIKSGEVLVRNNELKLNSINIDYNKMPVLINLSTKLNSKDTNFNADFSTILNESTADNIINPYLSYPVKVKGEVIMKGKFYGSAQNYSIDFTSTIPKDADISFSGANIGDIAQEREISGKINVNHNVLTLNNLRLIKYIRNQNNKLNPVNAININGKAIQKQDGIYYDNFKIVTTTPINVRILNLIFKKSILKKGNFECNINLNGNLQSPKIVGKIDLQDLDIPLYSTQINNIKVNITPEFIDANIIAKNNKSDIESNIRAVNNLTPPYVVNKFSLTSNKFDIKDIMENIPSQSTKTDIVKKQDFTIKPQDIIIKEGVVNINDVVYDKINLQNLRGYFSYNDNVFNLKNIIFNIAKGQVSTKGDYSLKTTKLNLKADIEDCDANILSKDFLNLSGQIYGSMTGTIDLSAKNLNTPDGIKNLQSNVLFSIDYGKMPKLGSLEYLLRAGNVIKNGILGLSINNLIQVLTPYRTGEFEKISGSLKISKGEVKDIEISSKGKNLSMYLFGEYNILDNISDITIYGRLSQNVSNALGAIGNASIKQFINAFRKKDSQRDEQVQKYLDKVPSVLDNSQGGFFSAKVYGDLNKDNYIKKFSWE